MAKKSKAVVLFSLLITSYLLRLISLNQSFWLDEAISANVIRNYSILDIITRFSPSDFHPPLFYLLLKTWSFVFGTSVVGLRLFSVTASVITGIFVYKISKLLFNKNVALWSTILLLVNPLFVYYSQELRMYSLVTLFLTISTYYFVAILKSNIINLKSVVIFNIFIFLSFLTFYGSIFYILTFYLILFFQKKYKSLFFLIPGFLLSLLLVSPLLYKQLFISRTPLKDVANWSLVLGKSNLKNILLIPLKFSFGRISFYPKLIYYLLSGFWTVFVFANIKKHKYLCPLFILPLVMAFIVSFKLPMLQYFRYLYLLPALSILLSRSMFKQIILAGFVILSLLYLSAPAFHREDWKSLSASLPQAATIYMIPSFADPLNYYRPDLEISDIRTIEPESQGRKALTIVPYGTDIYGFDYTKYLSSQNYTHFNTTNFNQITSEIWVNSL